ncbi:MAG: alanine--tRNA ligase [Eubacteriales bacterium]
MEKTGLNELRALFQKFYEDKGHFARKSFSLIPENDKSLLLINSGMAPLKSFFAGTETPPNKRMTTCQKCIRTGDIENVGHTARHATFFEMLGSFSFGDYFKKESISWGWEFIIDVLKMPEDKIWASIYENDEEAFEIWKNIIGLPENRIVRLGKDDNFWEIGVGPCGPCSEIYFDRGEKYGCGKSDCKPGCECDRYVEFWNHVFTQYNRDEQGNYSDLPKPNIDTGMGLERLACIMQEVDSIFEVDTIKYILDYVVSISNVTYPAPDGKSDISVRIITDHVRSVCFMLCDGVIPSNEGRGYVLRRLIRRAARHGRLIGIENQFLPLISKKVVEISKTAYPELLEKAGMIEKILQIEEDKFRETIDAGMLILNEHILELKNTNSNILSGEKAFKLYDTFGFPVELTMEILEEENCSVDLSDFNNHMEKQKNLARSARKSNFDAGWTSDALGEINIKPTIFLGYDNMSNKSEIVGLLKNGIFSKNASALEKVGIILESSCFYAESGGQSGDCGILTINDVDMIITNTIKMKDLIIHECELASSVEIGDMAICKVDYINRNSISRNHTATHLLHKALRETIGTHVEQAGSLVGNDRLRFDFKHFEAISKEQLTLIESIVNNNILKFLDVKIEEMDIEAARKTGAMALFGEKYKELVRVVAIEDYSIELCGGTHVRNTGQIGAFKIVSENGVAAGIRRIEAITGAEIYKQLIKVDSLVWNLSDAVKTTRENLFQKVKTILEENKGLKKEHDLNLNQGIMENVDEIIQSSIIKNDIKIACKKFDNLDIGQLRDLSDSIRAKTNGIILILATVSDGKGLILVSVSNDLLEKGYHAGNIIKEIAKSVGGGGGGKADMAQAGIKDISQIDKALEFAVTTIN